MKTLKHYALAILLIYGTNTKAQYVTIPDANFVSFLQTTDVASCMSGNQLDTACLNALNKQTLTIQNAGVSNLSGIEYFVDLQNLTIEGNPVSYLPPLPQSLINLTVTNNNIQSAAPLPAGLSNLSVTGGVNILEPYPQNLIGLDFTLIGQETFPALTSNLQYLSVANVSAFPTFLPSSIYSIYIGNSSSLTSISSLPASLAYFEANNTSLSTLPVLPAGVEYLTVRNSAAFTTLPALPAILKELKIEYCQLQSLPALPQTLEFLSVHHNSTLGNLPALPNSLLNIDIDYTSISQLPALPPNLTELTAINTLLAALPPLPSTLQYLSLVNGPFAGQLQIPTSIQHMNVLDITNLPNLTCLSYLPSCTYFYFQSTGLTCLPNYAVITTVIPPLNSLPVCNVFNANGCDARWNIEGLTYFGDSCTYTNNGPPSTLVKMQLYENGILQQQTFTKDGAYSFDTDHFGTYEVKTDTTGMPFTNFCPANGTRTSVISAADSMDFDYDFALHCKPGFDVGVHSVYSAGIFRPAHTTLLHFKAGDISSIYGAHCAGNVSGQIQLTLNGPISYVAPALGTPTPNSVNGNVITWNISDYGNVNFNTEWQVIVAIDTLAQIGSNACFTVSATTSTSGDYNTSNNTLTYCQPIVNSLDPNNKSVYPEDAVDTASWLTYTVRFQNTGNAPAIHVQIIDTMDADLDVSTFQLLNYSHDNLTQLVGNVVIFSFPNINLPDSFSNEPASHGFIQYKIKLKNGLLPGTQINNTAYIYFDLNTPVITNTTENNVCITLHNSIAASICDNDTFNFFGTALPGAGTYTHMLSTQSGCDSIITLTLSERPTFNSSIYASVCSNHNYNFYGTGLNTPGNYIHLLTAANGCDSLISLQLSVSDSTNTSIATSICDNDTLNFFGTILHDAGTYTHMLTAQGGCDSLISLTLSQKSTFASSISSSICNTETLNFFGTTISSAGAYTHTLMATNGCDSILTLNVIQLTADASFTLSNDTLYANSSTATTYQWINCSNGAVASNSSSFKPTFSGEYKLAVTGGDCADTSQCIQVTILGLSSAANQLNVQLMPNPATDKLQLFIDAEIVETYHWKIISAIGQLIRSGDLKQKQMEFDLSGLAAGTYILQLSKDGTALSKRFVKLGD